MEYKLEDSYTDPSRGRFQICIECLNVRAVHFNIYHGGNEPADVEPNFDEF
jgi:hypothetical protein